MSGDLGAVLRAARDSAAAIYVGRVEKLGDGRGTAHAIATVEVVLPLKGGLQQGARLELPAWGGGDCTVPFELGRLYLAYSSSADATDVSICSRTRPVSVDDPEVRWLQTEELPPVPVAVQRQELRCRGCSLQVEANKIIGSPWLEDWPEVGEERAEVALRQKEAFWIAGCKGEVGCPWRGVGVNSKGRAFQVTGVQDPDGVACSAALIRSWCESLERAKPTGWPVDSLRCIHPHDDTKICDEPSSLKAKLGPRVPTNRYACRWLDTRRADCREVSGVAASETAPVRGPVLLCRPRRLPNHPLACVVQ